MITSGLPYLFDLHCYFKKTLLFYVKPNHYELLKWNINVILGFSTITWHKQALKTLL
jgi:hypothetical protein